MTEAARTAMLRDLEAAVARQDFERAAELRDRLAAMEPGSLFQRQVPGKMGLGSDMLTHPPPAGWAAPAKPDLKVAHHRRRGQRK